MVQQLRVGVLPAYHSIAPTKKPEALTCYMMVSTSTSMSESIHPSLYSLSHSPKSPRYSARRSSSLSFKNPMRSTVSASSSPSAIRKSPGHRAFVGSVICQSCDAL